jgi:hypothetical protein
MNWHERIEAAKARRAAGLPREEWFTKDDNKAARYWPDCGCGQQDPRIPRYEDGQPKDNTLTNLGYDLDWGVRRQDPEYVATCLAKIEARAAEIVKGL